MAARIVAHLMEMLFSLVRSLCGTKADLTMEVLALRQQLAVYKRKNPLPHIDPFDRLFWSVLKDQFAGWIDALVIVKPETVVAWQKKRFQDFWAKKSTPGRPSIPRQHIAFIRRISSDHPEYGEDHIALELEIKFGIKHSEATVRKYMVKPGRPRTNPLTWRTFLENQAQAIWTCDFVVQHTVRFTALYIFVVVELSSRKVVHVNVTRLRRTPLHGSSETRGATAWQAGSWSGTRGSFGPWSPSSSGTGCPCSPAFSTFSPLLSSSFSSPTSPSVPGRSRP